MSKVLLLSGGIDSTALCAWITPTVALTIDYGQLPAKAEIEASAMVCEKLRIQHEIIRVDLRNLGSGDLTGTPVNTLVRDEAFTEWWPFRNQMLITIAAMKAASLGGTEIYVAAVKSDSLFMDGRKTFYKRLNSLLNVQEGALKLLVPAIELTSAELVRAAKIDSSTLALTHSCHTSNLACGTCRGCYKNESIWDDLGWG